MATPTSTWTNYRSARRTRTFPPAAIFYRDLWNHPVAANSAQMIAWLQSQHATRPYVSAYGYGTLAYTANLNAGFPVAPEVYLNPRDPDHVLTTWNTATSGGSDFPTNRLVLTGTPSAGGTSTGGAFPGDTLPGTVRIGASLGSGDPATRYEAHAGKPIGLHRLFSPSTSATALVPQATTALANRRLPWVSYKCDVAACIAGSLDNTIRTLITNLGNLNGPVWLTVWHEPENNVEGSDSPTFTIAQWRAVQRRWRMLIDQVGPTNIAFAPIFMGFTFISGPPSRPYRNEDDYWEPDANWDFIGVDWYQDSISAGTIYQPGNANQIKNLRTWAASKGINHIAIGEHGNLDFGTTGAAEHEALYNYALNSGADGGGARIVGISYWDSTTAGGYSSAFPDPSPALTKWRELIGRPTSWNADQAVTVTTPATSNLKLGGGHQLNDWEPNPSTYDTVIIDMTARLAYEYRRARITKGSNTPYADSVSRWDMDSYTFPVGSSGPAGALPSKLPYTGLSVTPDEVMRGWIGHMMGLKVRLIGNGAARWPARATNGTVAQTASIPRMGHVLRLKRNVNVKSLPTPYQVVCRALKRYGAIICDTHNTAGRAAELIFAPDPAWDEILGEQFDMGSFLTLDKFEVLDVDGLKVNAASMQSIPV